MIAAIKPKFHHTVSEESRAMLKRNGKDWRRLIMTIDDKAVRHAVACVVWWQYFGGREFSERWSELDDLITGPGASSVPREALKAGLIAIGFSEERAERSSADRLTDYKNKYRVK